MLLAGAKVFRVRAGYTAAFRLSVAAAKEFGWHDRNTGVNPATIQAKKTAALEVFERLDREEQMRLAAKALDERLDLPVVRAALEPPLDREG